LSAAQIATLLATERMLEKEILLPAATASDAAADGEQLVDLLTSTQPLSARLQAALQQLVDVVLAHSSSAAAAASSSSSTAARASSSSPSSPSSWTSDQRAALASMTTQHWMVHHAMERLLSTRLVQLQQQLSTAGTGVSSASLASEWSALSALAHCRIAHVQRTLRLSTHWSLAREYDRLGEAATLCAQSAAAQAAWQAAYEVQRACFGEQADSTRRARARCSSSH